MKRVLLLAGILFFALLVRECAAPSNANTTRDAAPTVRVIATGLGTWPAAPLEARQLVAVWSGRDRIGGAAGNTIVALVDREGGIRDHLVGPAALDPEARGALRREARVGDLLTIAQRGPLQASQVPGTTVGSSMRVERRTESGWDLVRTIVSRRDGIDVTLTIDGPVEAEHEPTSDPALLLLDRAVAAPNGSIPRRVDGRAFANGATDALLVPPTFGANEPNALRFEVSELAFARRFRARVAVNQGAYGRLRRAVFRLVVDDVIVGLLEVPTPAGELTAWHDWEVALPTLDAGLHVLVVEASPGSDAALPRYFLGAPQVLD